jgi:hypothetical protein
MEKIEIIQCKDKRVLLDYIKKNSSIQVFENMDINLLKNIALNIPILPKPKQTKQQKQEERQEKQK